MFPNQKRGNQRCRIQLQGTYVHVWFLGSERTGLEFPLLLTTCACHLGQVSSPVSGHRQRGFKGENACSTQY